MFSLMNLAFFKSIEEQLNKLSPEAFTRLIPGSKAPANAIMLGTMSDDLKALLIVKQSSERLCEHKTLELIRKGSTMTDQEIEDERDAIVVAEEFNKLYNLWFFASILYEFPYTDKASGLGYNENFEVYLVPIK